MRVLVGIMLSAFNWPKVWVIAFWFAQFRNNEWNHCPGNFTIKVGSTAADAPPSHSASPAPLLRAMVAARLNKWMVFYLIPPGFGIHHPAGFGSSNKQTIFVTSHSVLCATVTYHHPPIEKHRKGMDKFKFNPLGKVILWSHRHQACTIMLQHHFRGSDKHAEFPGNGPEFSIHFMEWFLGHSFEARPEKPSWS